MRKPVKNKLQEIFQKRGEDIPEYKTKRVGEQRFISIVTLHNGTQYKGKVCSNKKTAESSAASQYFNRNKKRNNRNTGRKNTKNNKKSRRKRFNSISSESFEELEKEILISDSFEESEEIELNLSLDFDIENPIDVTQPREIV